MVLNFMMYIGIQQHSVDFQYIRNVMKSLKLHMDNSCERSTGQSAEISEDRRKAITFLFQSNIKKRLRCYNNNKLSQDRTLLISTPK